jgi:hypothetical protein
MCDEPMVFFHHPRGSAGEESDRVSDRSRRAAANKLPNKLPETPVAQRFGNLIVAIRDTIIGAKVLAQRSTQ